MLGSRDVKSEDIKTFPGSASKHSIKGTSRLAKAGRFTLGTSLFFWRRSYNALTVTDLVFILSPIMLVSSACDTIRTSPADLYARMYPTIM